MDLNPIIHLRLRSVQMADIELLTLSEYLRAYPHLRSLQLYDPPLTPEKALNRRVFDLIGGSKSLRELEVSGSLLDKSLGADYVATFVQDHPQIISLRLGGSKLERIQSIFRNNGLQCARIPVIVKFLERKQKCENSLDLD